MKRGEGRKSRVGKEELKRGEGKEWEGKGGRVEWAKRSRREKEGREGRKEKKRRVGKRSGREREEGSERREGEVHTAVSANWCCSQQMHRMLPQRLSYPRVIRGAAVWSNWTRKATG